MATINPLQDYDFISTLTFASASGTCKIRLFKGGNTAYTSSVFIRAGTSGNWTEKSVSNINTTFNVTNTTMQVANNFGAGNMLTQSFCGQSTNLIGINISQISTFSSITTRFLYLFACNCSSLEYLDIPDLSGSKNISSLVLNSYADGCSSLTSLAIPDTSNAENVSTYFMYEYAKNCSSLERLELPKVGYFKNNNISWDVPSSREGVLKGYVQTAQDLSDWRSLTVDGKTLYTNYIRSSSDVISEGTGVQNMFIGDKQIVDIKFGNKQIKKVCKGSNLIFEK